MMKIKIGMFEFEGSQVEFDQIVKSGLLEKFLYSVKIEPKKTGDRDFLKDVLFGEKQENPNVDLYRPQPAQWPRIDPAELGIDTLKAKEAYLLSEDQRQATDGN